MKPVAAHVAENDRTDMTSSQASSASSGLTAQRIQTATPDLTRRAGRVLFLAFVSTLMLVQPVSAAAAQISELRPGAYVRIRAPGVLGGEVEGAILALDHDTLRVARRGSAPVAVPLASITRADVNRGRTRGAGARKGAKWGAGVGLGLGLFNIVFSDCSGTHCETSDNVAGVAAFTALGAGVGALVGSLVRAEHWERVQLPSRVAAPASAAATSRMRGRPEGSRSLRVNRQRVGLSLIPKSGLPDSVPEWDELSWVRARDPSADRRQVP